ncbi:MAG TPA: chemotaxis protein CheX [Polyangiaceae bacterium]
MFYDELVQVAQTVWESMLESELIPVPQQPEDVSLGLEAEVQVSGAWNGIVITSCRESLARRLAAKLLMTDPESVQESQLRDSLAEITNMLGGGIKALFSGECKLSLPSVVAAQFGTDPASELVDRVFFDWEGEPFRLELRRAI